LKRKIRALTHRQSQVDMGAVLTLWGSKSRPRSVTCGDRRSALQA
jgi:hypothetical protein